MNLWRLEWLRLIRTPRALALGAVYIAFGLIEPVATKYQNRLLGHVGNGVWIYVPPPTPAAGLSSYIGEGSLLGLIVVVILAAGAFSFDARRGVATFLRTRAASIWQLVTPRFAVCAGAAAIAYLLGTLAAWYETDLLIGSLPVGGTLAGVLCGAAYLAFAVAVTALAASTARSTLVNAPVDLVSGAHRLSHYLPTFAVTVAVSAAALAIAVLRLRTRET